MKREFLKELELTDEQIDKVMKEYGQSVNDIKDKADKVDGLESQIENYKEQIEQRDNQLEELGEKAKDNEELNNRIKELQDENKETAQSYEDKLAQQQKDFAIENALRDAKVKNPKIAKNALDVESVTFKDGKLLGFEEQINGLKESDGYLFESEEEPKLKGREPHAPKGEPKGVTKEQFEQMNYTERVELYNSNPDLYQKLKG